MKINALKLIALKLNLKSKILKLNLELIKFGLKLLESKTFK